MFKAISHLPPVIGAGQMDNSQNKKKQVVGPMAKVDGMKVPMTDGQWPMTEKYSGAYIGGVHLFPFRTEKLSPPEPMVLQ